MSGNTKRNTKRNTDNLVEPWKKGDPSPNPNGRPKGQKNYRTLYREALISIAKAKDKTPEEIEVLLHRTGIAKALRGEFNFYKDIQDRLHGKALQKSDVKLSGQINTLRELSDEELISYTRGSEERAST